MKIISGIYKGRNFYMPAGTRPTQDILRKAVFDILGQDLDGLTFIDLYAGSGAIGLEALSRRAKFVYFVERDMHAAEVIGENLRSFNIAGLDQPEPKAFVATADAFVAIKQLAKTNKKFDIAFIDPPYGPDLAKKTLKTLSLHDILHPACFILVQHHKNEILPESEGRFIILKQKRYGATVLTIYQGK